MKPHVLLLLFPFFACADMIDFEELAEPHEIVFFTKRIFLKDYPEAYNPSIIRFGEGFLLSFRYVPDPCAQPCTSYMGVVLLNEGLEPISEPQLLDTRLRRSKTPSQSEDARLFFYRDRLMLIYNDNIEVSQPSRWDRRDMFIVELKYREGRFTLSPSLKLIHLGKYTSVLWQKNWTPFEWHRTLFLIYSLCPHEILHPDLRNGECSSCYETRAILDWDLGGLKLSTPPLLVDGEYLSFFHSWKVVASEASLGRELWHYFMGAYTFSSTPPFSITRYTPRPIIAEGFYTMGEGKRVIFPGGCVLSGESILLAYGKDDCEIWIAAIDKDALKKALIPVGG